MIPEALRMAQAISSTRRRVLVVTDDASRGGTAHVAHQIAASLRFAFEIHFACRRNDATDGALAELERDGVVVHSYDVDEGAPWRNPLQSAFSINDALDLLEASDPDLVVTFDAAELFSLAALKFAAEGCGIPYIAVINVLLEDSERRFGAYFDLLAGSLAGAEAIVFACNAHLRRFEDALPQIHAPKRLIANSRPDRFFTPRNLDARKRLRDEFGVDDETLVCLTTARIEPHKGQTRIVRALALLARAGRGAGIRLVFAGTGLPHHLRELQEEIAALGLESSVSLLGARTDIADLLDASDVFILPSKSESTSLSIIEAMARSVPVVATGVDGILDLIDASCGILLPLEDEAAVHAIAEAIDRLRRDVQLRWRLADAARGRAERFRIGPTIIRYRDLLAEIARRRPFDARRRSFAREIMPLGGALDFSIPEKAWNFLEKGWSISEAEGIWTAGLTSTIRLRTNARKGQRLRLVFDFTPHLCPSWPIQESYVFVDGVPLAFWRLTAPGRQTRSLIFDVTDDSGMVALRFEHCRAVSPFALGLSPDPRSLALFFHRIEVLDAFSSMRQKSQQDLADA